MIYFSSWLPDSIIQGTWSIFVDANYVRRGTFYNESGDDLDEVNYRDEIPAGTYTLKVLHVKQSIGGILKVKIDGNVVLTEDCYNEGDAIFNQIATATGINISSSGVKTIQVLIDGKNASSTGYYANFSEFVFYRTA